MNYRIPTIVIVASAWLIFHTGALYAAAPTYASSLPAYQVRALSGTYAPTNGFVSLQSVTPADWTTSDPGVTDLRAVVVAWSGGFKAEEGTRLFVTGGGHNDSANNGTYIFDFDGVDRPTGWSVKQQSAVSSVRIGQDSYADGRPSAVHTYDGCVYASHNNTLYRFGGARYDANGSGTNGAWKYDLANDAAGWRRLPDVPGTSNRTVVYDPESRNIFVGEGNNFTSSFSGYFYRTSNDTYSAAKSYANYLGGNAVMAWDPTRHRALVVGQNGAIILDINFSSETVSSRGVTIGALTPGMSLFYDHARDVFWAFGGTAATWNTLYEIDASDLTVATHALTGDSIAVDRQSGGSFGRFVFLADWRAIGSVASTSSPAFIIKLPEGNVKKPNPPTDFQVQ